MLVYINHATCYVVATHSASLGAHSVTDALYHNILGYGPPNDTPRKDQLDIRILARAEAANVYMKHIFRININVIFIVGLIRFTQKISYYTTGRNKGSQTLAHLQSTICDCSSIRGRGLRSNKEHS
ncbi:hypothetical protein TNCV_2228731 [Trichonephila clavipes]|nr:hypothetical protein TNCV_2228731 [Trichonephila clavipes]